MSILTQALHGRLHGITPIEVRVTYRLADPSAITLSFTRYGRPHAWCVHRELLRAGVHPGSDPLPTEEPAARVQIRTFPEGGRTLLRLGIEGGQRWPLSLPTAAVRAFLERTYTLCSAEREARIVSQALDAHLAVMRVAQRPKRHRDGGHR